MYHPNDHESGAAKLLARKAVIIANRVDQLIELLSSNSSLSRAELSKIHNELRELRVAARRIAQR